MLPQPLCTASAILPSLIWNLSTLTSNSQTHPLQQQSEGEWHEPSPTTIDTPNHSSDPFPITVHQPFTWGSRSGPNFTQTLNTTYTEVIHWRCNCFSVPFGKVWRDLLYLAYGISSVLEPVTLKAAIVFPSKAKQKVQSKTSHPVHWEKTHTLV